MSDLWHTMTPAPISFRSSSLLGQAQLSLVLAHDLGSRACDHLIGRVATIASSSERRLGLAQSVHLEEVGSLEEGWVALDRAARHATPGRRALVLACLDLPPAPRAGATLASWALGLGLPVVAVTHSRRWLPIGDGPLSSLPVLSPTAEDHEIASVLSGALAAVPPVAPRLELDGPFASRPSWLG